MSDPTDRTDPSPQPRPAAAGTSAPSPAEPLAFRRDDGFDVPPAGALLLAVLLGVAAWAWWRRWRAGPAGTVAWPPMPAAFARSPGPAAPRLRVLASRRLDGSARVHVLECDGRRYLVGCNGQQAIAFVGLAETPAAAGEPT